MIEVARRGFRWEARFGARFASAVDLSELAGYSDRLPDARRAGARRESAAYLGALGQAGPDCEFALHGGPGWSGITGVLRGPYREGVERDAERVLERVLAVPEHLVAEPGLPEPDALEPPRAGWVAELRRRCLVAPATRPDAGKRYYLTMPPLVSEPRVWDGLVDRLPEGVRLVVGLRPVRVEHEFTARLRSYAEQYAVLAAPGEFSGGGMYSGRRMLAGEPFAADAAALFRDAAERYAGWAFQARVSLVAPGRLAPALVSALEQAVRGVLVEPTPPDRAAALRALTTWDAPAWGTPSWGADPAVPPALAPLRELADAVDAAQVAWLPAAATGVLRSLPVTPPPPERRTARGVVFEGPVTVAGDLVGGDKHRWDAPR
ncbi:hypothetical protein KCV87_21015 [Actinosynnema pretiosum subsp. pretiosum]|uniref:Uncharacterized protein n=1 Tax=Actinosynnema pretiosum subsp. pretiosum TaxID=103721 RepID=A0AA45L2G8_9PSEU|nr:hypothetical protein APASM_6927 [Actinosynnema pretiosum subsp. pretiosum]QUF02000.1 hypothetical protein KCV87_21015 [Actinosynnema pretiosum subsp. pretiosum]